MRVAPIPDGVRWISARSWATDDDVRDAVASLCEKPQGTFSVGRCAQVESDRVFAEARHRVEEARRQSEARRIAEAREQADHVAQANRLRDIAAHNAWWADRQPVIVKPRYIRKRADQIDPIWYGCWFRGQNGPDGWPLFTGPYVDEDLTEPIP